MFSVCLDDIIDIGVGGGGASSSYNANYQFARKKIYFFYLLNSCKCRLKNWAKKFQGPLVVGRGI